jgi:hypothetical protein
LNPHRVNLKSIKQDPAFSFVLFAFAYAYRSIFLSEFIRSPYDLKGISPSNFMIFDFHWHLTGFPPVNSKKRVENPKKQLD